MVSLSRRIDRLNAGGSCRGGNLMKRQKQFQPIRRREIQKAMKLVRSGHNIESYFQRWMLPGHS